MRRGTALVTGVLVSVTTVTQFKHRQKKQQTVAYNRLVKEVDSSSGDNKVTVLVTGGRGVLGRALIRGLVQDGGYNVHCLDLYIPAADDVTSDRDGVSSYVSTDITSKVQFQQAVKDVKPDAVFHMAALLPRIEFSASDIHRVNVEGTRNVISTCKELGVPRLVYTSSVSVYMDRHKLDYSDITEEYPLATHCIDAYAESKQLAESAVHEANGAEFSTCALRITSFLSRNSFLVQGLSRGRMFHVGDGSMRLPISDIDYLIKAHILAEKKLRSGSSSIASGKAYNIVGDSPTVKDLYQYHPDPNSDVTIFGHAKSKSMPVPFMYALCWINFALYNTIGYTFSPMSIPTSIKYMHSSLKVNGEKARKELGLEIHEPWQKTMEKYSKDQ